MRRELMRLGALIVVILAVISSGSMHHRATSADEPENQKQQVQLEKLKPKWRIGDQWVIETNTLQIQAREGKERRKPGPTLRWRYTVIGVERLGENNCFRIGIECLAKGRPQPATTIWVEVEDSDKAEFVSYVTSQAEAHPIIVHDIKLDHAN